MARKINLTERAMKGTGQSFGIFPAAHWRKILKECERYDPEPTMYCVGCCEKVEFYMSWKTEGYEIGGITACACYQ